MCAGSPLTKSLHSYEEGIKHMGGWEGNYCNSKFCENEILHNFKQSSNTLLKKVIVIVKYQDLSQNCIVSNYRIKDSPNGLAANCCNSTKKFQNEWCFQEFENTPYKFHEKPKEKAIANFTVWSITHIFFPLISLISSKLMCRFSQLQNWAAGFYEISKFLKIDLNLESKQSLDLGLQYSESHEMFPVLGITDWNIFVFPLDPLSLLSA